MADKKTFSEMGANLGKKLDKLSQKVQSGELREDATKLGKKIVETTEKTGSDAAKFASNQYDKAVGEDKHCIACGAKLGLVGKRKMLDGTLCKNCAPKYIAYSEKLGFNLATTKFSDIENDYLEFERKEKEKKKKTTTYVLIGLAIFLILDFVFLGIMAKKEHENEIQIPEISSVYYGENYEIVKDDLESYGFTNVWTEELNDLSDNEDKLNTVDHITIDGKGNYKTDDWVEPSVKVVVYYHSMAPVEENVVENSNTTKQSKTTNETKSEDTSKTYTTEEYGELLQAYLNQEFPDDYKFTVTTSERLVNVVLAMNEVKSTVNYALVYGGEYKTAWNDLLDTCQALNQEMTSGLGESGLGMDTMALYLVDKTDEDTTYAVFTNGDLIYNAVEGN